MCCSLGDKNQKARVENVACFVGLKYDTQGTMPTFLCYQNDDAGGLNVAHI